jgi:hypothetical protein
MKFDFHLLKHPHLWHPWCIFWCLLLLSKKLGLPNVFPTNILQCIYYHTSQQPLVQKIIKYKILLTQVLIMSPMYLLMSLVSSNIVYMAFNTQLLIVPSCLKRTSLLEFSFCCCSPIFHHCWCCLNVFLLLTKLRSCPHKPIMIILVTRIWIQLLNWIEIPINVFEFH